MRKALLSLTVAILLTGMSPIAFADYMQTFDKQTSDWQALTINDKGDTRSTSLSYNACGGYVSVKINNSSKRVSCLQTTDVELGSLIDHLLTVDFMINGQVKSPATPTVRFFVGSSGSNNYFVSNDTYSWNPNKDTGWIHHQVQLNSANFLGLDGSTANIRTFNEVLTSPMEMGLVFTGSSKELAKYSSLGFSCTGKATISIDNFGAIASSSASSVPEPATLMFLFVGAVSVVRRTCL